MTMMMRSMMIATTALVIATLAGPCEAATHRRAAGTELYRVQPTQKVRSLVAATSNNADFERFGDDAKRALRELMAFPTARHLSLEVSMEYLSLSFAPVISMSMSLPPMINMSPTPVPVSDVLVDGSTTSTDVPGRGSDTGNSKNNNNVAPVNRAAGAGGENGTRNEFNKPATISVTVFLLIAAMAVTALVVRKYKRVVVMGAGGPDDQSILTGSVFSYEPGQNIPSPV